MPNQKQGSEQLQTLMQSGQISGSFSFNGTLSKEDEEMSRSALSTFKAKEEEIEKRKMEVKERVQAQLGRVEEETRRLAIIREVCLQFHPFFLSLCQLDYSSFSVAEYFLSVICTQMYFFFFAL